MRYLSNESGRTMTRHTKKQEAARLTLCSCRLLLLFFLAFSFCLSEAAAQRATGLRKPVAGPASSDADTSLTPSARNALNVAVAALQANALGDAERAARAAVTASPRSATTHNVLGVVLDRSGRRDEAFDEFNTAVKLDPGFIGARNNLGRLLAERGQTSAAIAQFESVLKTDPSHVQAHYNLGALYSDAGDFAKAVDHFARARQVEPDDPQLALAYVNVAYRASRRDDANSVADWLERKFADDPKGLLTLAIVVAQNKEYDRAVKLFERVNKAMPHTYEVLYNLGIALYDLDRNDDAARYLAEAADLNPAPAETHFRLALIASGQSDHANAVEEFKHAIERQPKDANFHYLLGREYFRVGYWEGAINEFNRAIEIDSDQAVYYLARADASYRKGEAASAALDFDRAAQLNPNIENIEYWQGYAHRVAGNFDLARQHLENFLSKHPEHVDTLASLGFISIEQGRVDEAEALLERALRINPNEVVVLYDYARVALKRRDYAEAAKRLAQVIAKHPAYTQAYYQLFLAYTRLKQADKAQAALVEFKRLDALEKQTNQERIMDDKVRTQQMLGQTP